MLSHLELETSSLIDEKVFQSGLMGPDPFIFYRFFAPQFRHGINKRGNQMHTSKTNTFLLALARRSRERLLQNRDNNCFSFMCGFLCHFSLDSIVHPIILPLEVGQRGIHTAIEHRIEMMVLKRDDKRLSDITKLLVTYHRVQEFEASLKEVYGWEDNCFAIGYKHMKLYYSIVKDQHGLIEKAFHKFPGKLSALSYRTRDADDIDLSWYDEAEERAITDSLCLITTFRQYCQGIVEQQDLKTAIGERTYLG